MTAVVLWELGGATAKATTFFIKNHQTEGPPPPATIIALAPIPAHLQTSSCGITVANGVRDSGRSDDSAAEAEGEPAGKESVLQSAKI